MPNTREKLIELLWRTNTTDTSEEIADHLIANGVTVQGDKDINVPSKWISVKDRLPEYNSPVMGWDSELRDMGIANFLDGDWFDIEGDDFNVTHWMPLPQPPKGE